MMLPLMFLAPMALALAALALAYLVGAADPLALPSVFDRPARRMVASTVAAPLTWLVAPGRASSDGVRRLVPRRSSVLPALGIAALVLVLVAGAAALVLSSLVTQADVLSALVR